MTVDRTKSQSLWKSRIVGENDVPPSDLIANPRNWRTHPKEQIDALNGLLTQVGWVQRVIVNRQTGHVVDGHARVALAKKRNEERIPVLYVDLTEEEERIVLAAIDPIGAMAGTDEKTLSSLLDGIKIQDEALQSLLENISKTANHDNLTASDDVPELSDELLKKWRVDVGQVWNIPSHTQESKHHVVACGNSADRSIWQSLLNEQRATCIFTDPPYGVSVAAKNRAINAVEAGRGGRVTTDIVSDDLSPEELRKTLVPIFETTRHMVASEDCTWIVCAPQGGDLGMMMMMMMRDAGLTPKHVLIWMKSSPTFSLGRLDYDYQHEPMLLTWGKRHKRPMRGEHRTSVWQVAKPRSSKEHPTMKPVELYVNAYLNHSDQGDVVADPFGGSGTCLAAAEATKRLARIVEIEPRYVAVILERAETLGLHPVLLRNVS